MEECNSWFFSYGYIVFASRGSDHSRGIVILFRPVFSLVSTSCDSNGYFPCCEFLFRDRRFRVISLYAPNTNPQRDDFFAYVASMVDLSFPSVLCGDFNAVLNRHLDRTGPSTVDSSRDSSVPLRAIFQECCVVDAWSYCHPPSQTFTWLLFFKNRFHWCTSVLGSFCIFMPNCSLSFFRPLCRICGCFYH